MADPDCELKKKLEQEEQRKEGTVATTSAVTEGKKENLFEDLDAESLPTIIESLCMNCEKNGTTRLLLTKIPFFREIVIMAFSCKHCGYRSNEVQNAGSIEERGCTITLRVETPEDLNRQVVKSETASIQVPELELEIPSVTQAGSMNTIQGVLVATSDALRLVQQSLVAQGEVDSGLQLGAFCNKLDQFADGDEDAFPFTIVLDDPAGNSHIENPRAPKMDPQLHYKYYMRTQEQNKALGLQSGEGEAGTAASGVPMKPNAFASTKVEELIDAYFDPSTEVVQLPGVCPDCNSDQDFTRSLMVDIPFFKEVLIMSYTCSKCGYKSNEVKAGGAIPSEGQRVTLREVTKADFNRDVLKAETASVIIPELRLEVTEGSLGGKFTTVEGLLNDIHQSFAGNPFVTGDSANQESKSNMARFVDGLAELLTGEKKFTLILEDPVANSYIQNPFAPNDDPRLTSENFVRTYEQDEELGLNDIDTHASTGAEDHERMSAPTRKDFDMAGKKTYS
eukprot:CAMPEP_0177649110 /NCGR_PEP_ID=MMETSP0447-20121125/11193_1 /TAXON_ID=0 /ORGANISM="Stygamoeba regulata, Strain BSH-02190019" /LENGTH=507 /DNA_ID=CAMNT_0019151809 /DNA_START=145 /DNA_END=1668 /DNA_ORIENTATION=+